MGRSALVGRALLLVLTCCAAALGCSKFSAADDDAPADAGPTEEEAGTAVDGGGPAAPPFFLDTFSRTESTGWGRPDVGERWRVVGASSVENGAGRMQPLIGEGVYAFSDPVSVRDVDIQATFASSAVGGGGPDAGLGGGLFLTVLARSSNDDGFSYGAAAIVQEGGRIGFLLTARVATVEKRLARLTAAPTVKAGEAVRVRLQVTGALPTQVRGKVWLASEPEPDAWTGEGTDSTPTLQQAGRIGVTAYLSGSATITPVGSVDELTARALP